ASSGHDPVIFSRLRKSPMRGAQYLHKPIPGLPEDQFKINYVLVGEPDVYRTKVYGPSSDVRVSVESLQGVSPAWDIRTVYDDLWARYKRLVSDRNLTPTEINRAIKSVKPDITISTIPAKLLCNGVRHTFSSTHVWVSEEA